jgi:F0F1-type ATP synthase delta subunit
MMDLSVAIKIAVLMLFVTGIIIFFLHRFLISSTEGAVKRLNDEIEKAQKRQAELTQKLREADEELNKRRAEAKALADKTRQDTEQEAKAEREKIIAESRKEGEEIISKAQGAAEKLKAELVKEIDSRGVDFALQIMARVLSEKSKGSLNRQLVAEFLDNFKSVDMSRLSLDIQEAELVCTHEIDDKQKVEISQIMKQKLNRELPLKVILDEKLAGGIMVKFGSMAIDGSVRNLLREEGKILKAKIENG